MKPHRGRQLIALATLAFWLAIGAVCWSSCACKAAPKAGERYPVIEMLDPVTHEVPRVIR
jgi:hypothetical protein